MPGSCNSCLGCSHSQPPFTTPGNHKENTMAKQLCNFLTVLEFSLESSGMDSVHSAGTLPWVQEFREHNHRRVARVTLRELTWESGTNLEQEKPPGPLGCVCPVPPGVLAIPTCCPRCELTQPLWDAGLGSLTSAHCRAAQEQHLRAQSPAWAAVPLPSSCPPHPALAALPEPLPTPLCITPPPAPVFPSNRQLRHSRNTFGKKPVRQELESPAASNTKATHSIAIF